ncbi:transporter substrate-binding domain-containing protein [Microbacterium sp. CPCC 204701]|uniref:transporter substrate-binding domain-containing protein n=1 Tax=Microbacterium sp. CPCC 204701 TaxID=2493084 RepID=UPI000FD72DB7|nr:transporter substrate-binding domain-containing protein [Microbacterium sp. CPCC 204701]
MALRTTLARVAVAGVATLSLLAMAGCATPAAEPAAVEETTASELPTPEFSQEIQDLFPAEVVEAGVIRAAAIPLPPYSYKDADGTTDIGINWDTAAAIEALTGLDVELEVAPTQADIFTGFTSDRYDIGLSPLSNIPATQQNYDFAVWVAEYVVFIQTKDATVTVDSLESACGATIATLKGGTAQTVLENASAKCADEPIDIALYADQDSAILAVKSGRADAAFSSQIPLTYYANQDDYLVLSGANSTDNGFPPFWVGTYAPKGSELIDPMLGVWNGLKEAGFYDALLTKYDIKGNAMDEFGINLAVAP